MDLIDGVAKVSSIGWTKGTKPDSISILGINPKDRGIKIMAKKEIEIDNMKENEIEIETEITAIPRTSISKDICDDICINLSVNILNYSMKVKMRTKYFIWELTPVY